MEENVFWPLVKELYPLFLAGCLIIGVWRMSRGILQRLRGEEDGIAKAISDIIVGFFFAHMTLPLVYGLFVLMGNVGDKAEKVVKILGG